MASPIRRIVHVDMDAFYASVEVDFSVDRTVILYAFDRRYSRQNPCPVA